jgi:hypothetical protein
MTSAWDHKEMLKECTFITLEKNKILFVQGDSIDSLFMVITGTLRVMVKFDNHNKPKREEEEGASPNEMKKVPIAGKHDLGQQVALLDKGDTIGEMCLMLQEDQSASVVAAEECNILRNHSTSSPDSENATTVRGHRPQDSCDETSGEDGGRISEMALCYAQNRC